MNEPADQRSHSGSPGAALVTGGGTGIGQAISMELAQRGMDVFVNYRRDSAAAESTAASIRELGRRATALQADVSEEAQVGRMMRRVAGEYGDLSLLVNNAGWTRYVPPGRLEDLDDALIDRTLAVNLKGVLLCSRAALALLRTGRGGHVVNIASTSGLDGRGSNIIYCAAKAGVLSLTRSLAGTLAPAVRVNAVCPGFVKTRFITGVPQEMIDDDTRRTPLGRLARPVDVARAVATLHLDLLAVTGEALVVDGGRLASG